MAQHEDEIELQPINPLVPSKPPSDDRREPNRTHEVVNTWHNTHRNNCVKHNHDNHELKVNEETQSNPNDGQPEVVAYTTKRLTRRISAPACVLAASRTLSEVQPSTTVSSPALQRATWDSEGGHDDLSSGSYDWDWVNFSLRSDCKGTQPSRKERFLTVVRKMRRAVVRHLLTLQVIFFFISVVLAGMVFMPLALVTKGFKGQCMLFSDITLEWNTNNTVTVDLEHTRYGSVNDCDLPTFIAVSVCVVCIIFSWFYMCSIFAASDDTKQATNRIQIPALLIFLSLFISTIVAAFKISAGFRVWCENIVDNAPAPARKLHCSDFQSLEWTNNIDNYLFYTRYLIAEVACWLLCVSLFALCCVTCVGCYQMLSVGEQLVTTPATSTLSLVESEDGTVIVVKLKREQELKAELEGSSQDYFTPVEDLEPRHENPLEIKATVHFEKTPNDNPPLKEGGSVPTEEVFMSDISDTEGFSEGSETVASGRINSSDCDEVPSVISSLTGSHEPRNKDESLTKSEKESLSKKATSSGGYGALSSHR